MLIPDTALAGNYRVVGVSHFWGSPGEMAVTGTEDGTSRQRPGPASRSTPAAGSRRTDGTVTLNRGDVLQITNPAPSNQAYGGDMSGTSITASHPVEVFGGHNCVYIDYNQGYCDHLEEIIFPLETLRSDYLVSAPYNANGTPQAVRTDRRHKAGTTLTFDPASVHASATIGAGQVLTFETTKNCRASSLRQPIIIGQYMEGCDNFTRSATAAIRR